MTLSRALVSVSIWYGFSMKAHTPSLRISSRVFSLGKPEERMTRTYAICVACEMGFCS